MKSCLIIVVIIDHLESGLEPEPVHVAIKPQMSLVTLKWQVPTSLKCDSPQLAQNESFCKVGLRACHVELSGQ